MRAAGAVSPTPTVAPIFAQPLPVHDEDAPPRGPRARLAFGPVPVAAAVRRDDAHAATRVAIGPLSPVVADTEVMPEEIVHATLHEIGSEELFVGAEAGGGVRLAPPRLLAPEDQLDADEAIDRLTALEAAPLARGERFCEHHTERNDGQCEGCTADNRRCRMRGRTVITQGSKEAMPLLWGEKFCAFHAEQYWATPPVDPGVMPTFG